MSTPCFQEKINWRMALCDYVEKTVLIERPGGIAMDKLLVIFTGGTIGSQKTGRTIDVDASAAYQLIGEYRDNPRNREVQLDTVQPLQVLSENMVPADWVKLIACLDGVDFSIYKGIIITHGSDTLPYTSAA